MVYCLLIFCVAPDMGVCVCVHESGAGAAASNFGDSSHFPTAAHHAPKRRLLLLFFSLSISHSFTNLNNCITISQGPLSN